MPPIRLLLADDHEVIRSSLALALRLEPNIEVIAEVATGEEAVVAFQRHRPDVTLLDVRMPGAGGLAALRAIREVDKNAHVLMLTSSDAGNDVALALSEGAAGYLVKNAGRAALIDAIQKVHRGERAVPANLTRLAKETENEKHLTLREREVLDLIRKGYSNRDIGGVLGITERTAKCHVAAIMVKLQAADRAEAVAIGFERGLLRMD